MYVRTLWSWHRQVITDCDVTGQIAFEVRHREKQREWYHQIEGKQKGERNFFESLAPPLLLGWRLHWMQASAREQAVAHSNYLLQGAVSYHVNSIRHALLGGSQAGHPAVCCLPPRHTQTIYTQTIYTQMRHTQNPRALSVPGKVKAHS